METHPSVLQKGFIFPASSNATVQTIFNSIHWHPYVITLTTQVHTVQSHSFWEANITPCIAYIITLHTINSSPFAGKSHLTGNHHQQIFNRPRFSTRKDWSTIYITKYFFQTLTSSDKPFNSLFWFISRYLLVQINLSTVFSDSSPGFY